MADTLTARKFEVSGFEPGKSNPEQLSHQVETIFRLNGWDRYNSNVFAEIIFYVPSGRLSIEKIRKMAQNREIKPSLQSDKITSAVVSALERHCVSSGFEAIASFRGEYAEIASPRIQITVSPGLIIDRSPDTRETYEGIVREMRSRISRRKSK